MRPGSLSTLTCGFLVKTDIVVDALADDHAPAARSTPARPSAMRP